ncbi:nitroreductase family protein [Trinickia symbiotica]|uniref:Nitroreductase family protein n=1 Tax=Trinickia symbiotica TaxID=863227 RepID=A0A2T3XLF5_9BURK|nr:nitroreductase family protein [Trinickia symbiotica]PTB17289.1 nitroreductase family protein [Trinickia symbiotica]
MAIKTIRTPSYPIDAQFVERWSPRAFTSDPIDERTILTILEAARWAPSSYNSQPWRFVYARRETDQWVSFLSFLNEFNRSWAVRAAAIVVVLSKQTFRLPGKSEEASLPTHSFDAGAAWAFLALQASLLGWGAHALAGINSDHIRSELSIPDDFSIEACIALGRAGDAALLPHFLQAKEVPSERRPLVELAAEGRFVDGT